MNALRTNVETMSSEGGGLLRMVIITHADHSGLLAEALDGNTEAVNLIDAISQTAKRVEDAPQKKPMLCASCPRPLQSPSYSFAVAIPDCDNPTNMLAMAVCTHCGTGREAIMESAVKALRRLWPGLRSITITHSGGSA